jgi:hypothetical protein
MNHRLIGLALLAGCAFAGSAGAAAPDDEYRAGLDRAQAAYKNAWDSCRALKANARDVCQVEAKGNYQVAKAELDTQHKRTPKHEDKVKTEKAKAAYKLASEKCDDLSGNARDVCRKDAKASFIAAQAESKVSRAAVDKGVNSRAAVRERKDGREDTRDAQLAAARERCEALAGRDAKSACVGDAKRKFGKM